MSFEWRSAGSLEPTRSLWSLGAAQMQNWSPLDAHRVDAQLVRRALVRGHADDDNLYFRFHRFCLIGSTDKPPPVRKITSGPSFSMQSKT